MNGHSVFARVQQFSNQLYALCSPRSGCIPARDAAFWGHNAILRNQPFMQHAVYASCPAGGLFRGPILSHGLVEAAYIARAGYEVG